MFKVFVCIVYIIMQTQLCRKLNNLTEFVLLVIDWKKYCVGKTFATTFCFRFLQNRPYNVLKGHVTLTTKLYNIVVQQCCTTILYNKFMLYNNVGQHCCTTNFELYNNIVQQSCCTILLYNKFVDDKTWFGLHSEMHEMCAIIIYICFLIYSYR